MMKLDWDEGLKVIQVVMRHRLEDAVPASTIQEVTGVHWRKVTDYITSAAEAGMNVGSCGRGYFLWRNREEKEVYLRQEKARRDALSRKISHIEHSTSHELTLFEQESAA